MSLRALLSRGRLLTGPFLAIPAPMVVEIACASRPDFVCIDMEHAAIGPETGENMLRAAAVHGVPALVRVPSADPVAIAHALDWGAAGVLVPRVQSAAEARGVVEAARFPPQGNRGAGPGRAAGYGRAITAAIARARDETVVAIQIETVQALAALDEILAVGGVDLLFVGPGDLGIGLDAAGRSGELPEAIDRVLDACAAAGRAAGIFAMTRAALRPHADRVALGILGSDATVLVAGFDAAFGNAARADPARGDPPVTSSPTGRDTMTSASVLQSLGQMIASGGIEVVDCSGVLGPETPLLKLPPELAVDTPPVRIHRISEYDKNGPFWAWNWLELGEHSGTHFDAPHHWITGRDYPDGYTDTLDVQRLVAPVNVLDFSAECAADPDFLLTVDHVKTWEARHGAINAGEWVVLRSDWDQRAHDEALFLNADATGPHTPGPTAEAIEYLIGKGIVGWGSQCIGTDAGQAGGMEPPFPAHNLLHKNNRFGLASLANLSKLPAKGAILIAAPLKIRNGTGSPIRALALVPRG